MSDRVLALKLGIGLAGGIAAIFFCSFPAVFRCSKGRFDLLAFALLLGSRLAMYVLTYVILGQEVPSDVPWVYYPPGQLILEGKLPYRDFESSYAPLFGFVSAALISLWNNTKVFVLFAIAVEAVSLWMWMAVARMVTHETTARQATVLNIVNTNVLQTVLVGTNQIWIACLLGWSLLLVLRRKDVASGAVMALSITAIKILGIMFAPMLWLAATDTTSQRRETDNSSPDKLPRADGTPVSFLEHVGLPQRRLRWTIGFLAPTIVVYGIFMLLGVDILFPLKFEGGLETHGNIPYFLSLFGFDPSGPTGKFSMLLMGLIAAGLCLRAWAQGIGGQPARIIDLISLIMLTFMLLSKKAFPAYLATALFPLCLTIARHPFSPRALWAHGLFIVLTTVQSSFWFRWMDMGNFSTLWNPALPENQRWTMILFAVMECVLLIFYAAYWLKAYRGVFGPQQPAQDAPTA